MVVLKRSGMRSIGFGFLQVEGTHLRGNPFMDIQLVDQEVSERRCGHYMWEISLGSNTSWPKSE